MKTTSTLLASALLAGLVTATTVLSAGASDRDVEHAKETTAKLADAVVAAVVNLSDSVPAGSSIGDITSASRAVSLIVPDCQDAYRLVDATGNPIDANNAPIDAFEVRGLMQLSGGAAVVQEVDGAYLRTMAPLTNDMHPNCATCHTAYTGMPANTFVGAAAFKVGL